MESVYMDPLSQEITTKNLIETIQQAYRLREKKQYQLAVDIAQKCLKFFPQHPEVHCLLGLLQLDARQFQQAEKSFNTAISLQPDKADFYFFLGQLFKSQRRPQEAQSAYLQCIKLNKNHVHALLNLGNIYDALNKVGDAINVFKQITEIDPNFYMAFYNLGIIYHKLNKYGEAIRFYRQALKINPNDVLILSNLGAAYTKDRQFKEAVTCYEKALMLDPKHVPTLTNLGGTYIEMNDFAKGKELMERSLALEPNMPGNWRNLSLCKHYHSLDDLDVKKIKELLNHPKISEDAKIHLYFALGKIYDDCKQYVQAFEYYKQGNDLQAKQNPFNPAIFKNHISRIINFFNQDILNKFSLPSLANEPKVVFIVGTPRSGKSLLEELLAQHPLIHPAGEIGIAEYGMNVPIELMPRGNYPYWIKDLSLEQAQAIRTAYLTRLRKDFTTSQQVIIDTLPGNLIYLGLLFMLFPQAKVIHCWRDPFDTCLLMYFKYFVYGHGYTNHLQTLGAYFQQYQRMIDYWKGLLPNFILDVSYEELLAHPYNTLQTILKFIHLDEPHLFKLENIYNREINHWKNYEQFLAPLKEGLKAEIPVLSSNLQEEELKDLLTSAYQSYAQGDFQITQMLCENILLQAPNHSAAVHLLGSTFFRQKQYEKALLQFENAIKLSPFSSSLYVELGNTYKALGKQMQADLCFKKASQLLITDSTQNKLLQPDQRAELLNAFTGNPEVIDEFENRLLLQGKVATDLTTDSFMTGSWDQYFTDLSFGSYRNIEKKGKRAWRIRTWHFLFKNLSVVDNILAKNQSLIRILDIGCSSGYLRRFLEGNVDPKEMKKIYYWGLDVREDVLSSAVKEIDNIESGAAGNLVPSAFIVHDIVHGLPFQNDFFDFMVNFEMIKYLPIEQGKKLLLEMHRVLNKQGRLYLSTTYSANTPGFMQSVPYEQLERMLQQSGFNIIERRGSQTQFQSLSPHFKAEHLPLIQQLLTVHPPELVAAMVGPLYPFCAEQVTFICQPQ